MAKWRAFEGNADYYGDVTVVRCACGDRVSLSDEAEKCATCGREYKRQVIERVFVKGDGNGETFVPPPPQYGSIYFVRAPDGPDDKNWCGVIRNVRIG